MYAEAHPPQTPLHQHTNAASTSTTTNTSKTVCGIHCVGPQKICSSRPLPTVHVKASPSTSCYWADQRSVHASKHARGTWSLRHIQFDRVNQHPTVVAAGAASSSPRHVYSIHQHHPPTPTCVKAAAVSRWPLGDRISQDSPEHSSCPWPAVCPSVPAVQAAPHAASC